MSPRITAAIVCPNCGQKGVAVWQSNPAGARTLLSLTGAFHKEDGRLPTAEAVIVCNECDEILLPDET